MRLKFSLQHVAPSHSQYLVEIKSNIDGMGLLRCLTTASTDIHKSTQLLVLINNNCSYRRGSAAVQREECVHVQCFWLISQLTAHPCHNPPPPPRRPVEARRPGPGTAWQ